MAILDQLSIANCHSYFELWKENWRRGYEVRIGKTSQHQLYLTGGFVLFIVF